VTFPPDFVERLCRDFAGLSLEDIPELELLVLGSLAEFLGSPNFRDDSDMEHASVGLLAACWDGVSHTKGVSGVRNESAYGGASAVRHAILEGAHTLASQGEAGLLGLMETLVPVGEQLIDQGWPPDPLAYQFAVSFLANLAGQGEVTRELIDGIAELLPKPGPQALPAEVIWGYESWQGYWAFLPREDAEYWDGVQRAIASRRWSELRRAVTVGDRDDIDDWGLEEGPSETATFDPDELPGHADGDWPPMPGALMLGWLPGDLVESYGEVMTTVLNGDRLDIGDEEQARGLAAALAERGVILVRDDALVERLVGTIGT